MSCLDVDNDNNLMKFNNEHTKGVWFVWFYAEWCGHCHQMVPQWEDLKNNNKHGVRLAKIRDDYIPHINSNPPVEGYPTIILYKNGNVEETYRGERSGSAFNNFLGEKVNAGESMPLKKVNLFNNNSGIESEMNNNVVRLEKPKKKKSKKSKKSAKNSKKSLKSNNNKKKSKSKKSKKSKASNK